MEKRSRFRKKRSEEASVQSKLLPITLSIGAIILCFLAIFQYFQKQQFTVAAIDSTTIQQLVESKEMTQGEAGKFNLKLTDYEWSQLLLEQLQSEKFGKYEIAQSIYENGVLHLELENENGKSLGYSTNVEFLSDRNDILLQFSTFRLGTLNSTVLGFLASQVNDLPSSFTTNFTMNNKFIYVSDVKKLEDGVELQLTYDSEDFAKRIIQYVDGIDAAKLALQKSRGNMDESVLEAIQADPKDTGNQQDFIDYIKQSEDSLTNFALIFNEQTTRNFLMDFKDLYAKRINVERIVVRSKSDLEQSVQTYHHQFSRALLAHLFNNPSYEKADGSFLVNGQPITAATIISSQGLEEKYKTTIVNEDAYLYAKYSVGDNEMTKVVLKKEGVQ